MAFLVRSPDIPTRIFSDSNSSASHAFTRRRGTVSARDSSSFKIQKSRLYAKFSAPAKEDCKISRHDEENKESYYVNKGHAVQCLREELPSLFLKDPSFHIYRSY
ncbi:hypothetical protein IGI04_010877 [Brassica rapa subsp. trilocularis]|uniref:Uncharacterized protein n=1 Tax=Brassica rapa subsp. trilocularis TaxID=1813537 RepID=A0ABQ7N2C6_BRACM|nr:hypothetical protein IGI04_010877 [Brassica rapa subsp. trilocularis]